MNNLWQLRAVLIGFVILALLIALNSVAFYYFGHANYIRWYINNGSMIALGASFVGLIWEGLALREDLLSSHPLRYLRGCFGLVSVFFHSVSVHLSNPFAKTVEGPKERSIVSTFFDSIVSYVVLLLMTILVLAWLLVIAPINYFLTLISGAVARQEREPKVLRAIAVRENSGIELTSQSIETELPKDAVDVSLARQPFVLTQAINSLILWIVSIMLTS